MNVLNKAVIVEALSEVLDISAIHAKHMAEIFFETLALNLEKGHNIKLSGFGNFMLRDKGARPGRNPRTGQLTPIEPRRVVTFKPGMKLKHVIEKKVN
ncbi:MAG: integration host factor subunit alpha [Legionellaceae bacterium]|nr:integration host factor subunit alpha [Legionellaceae bacterium]HAF87094.1 integration host factor subunit alpha [Legionellales bacterium]HCA89571.1 integration host factor subunit alpha [Legionellales bacterium]